MMQQLRQVAYPVAWDVRLNEKTARKRSEKKCIGPLACLAGARRYSCLKNPDIPTGDGTENLQFGFKVLPIKQTDWLSHCPV